jgi:hypothetical protein
MGNLSLNEVKERLFIAYRMNLASINKLPYSILIEIYSQNIYIFFFSWISLENNICKWPTINI